MLSDRSLLFSSMWTLLRNDIVVITGKLAQMLYIIKKAMWDLSVLFITISILCCAVITQLMMMMMKWAWMMVQCKTAEISGRNYKKGNRKLACIIRMSYAEIQNVHTVQVGEETTENESSICTNVCRTMTIDRVKSGKPNNSNSPNNCGIFLIGFLRLCLSGKC